MLSQIRPALVSLALFSAITGIAYPLLVTGIAQAAFPHRANGSIVYRGGQAVGSRLIGQPFALPGYFWTRPSATVGPDGKPLPYRADASGGSNYGPTNPALTDEARERVEALGAAQPRGVATSPAPVDLVTSSGSGLDPDLSPEAAYYLE